MTNKVISLKSFRKNITTLWKEAREKNIKYIVLYHSKPILEVSPRYDEELIFKEDENDYYKTLETSLSFWKNDDDDDIFKM
ncbi:hypothetical protein HYV57_01600 [Candidatus Peregrinibacteria bacterium]|nr:hypothetical protein [Candidatus Peregrinibacteria bacterium]